MDAHQFQAAVLAWGAAATTLIAVLLGIALAVRSALNQLMARNVSNAAKLAAVETTIAHHEIALNGGMTERIAAIADQRIAAYRRSGDLPTI